VASTSVSVCQRFVVVDGLHVDRAVFAALQAWASERGVSVQDAIQLAICFFNECRVTDVAPLLRPIVTGEVYSGGGRSSQGDR